MEITHRLLKRQMKRYLGSGEVISGAFAKLLISVEEAYRQFETDYSTLERALELSSQELREHNSGMRAVYEHLVNSSENGVFAFDCECRFTVWNPAMKGFTSMNNLQMLGKRTFDLFPGLTQEVLESLFHKALSGSTMSQMELIYINEKTGGQGFCEFFLAPLRTEDGAIIGGVGVLHDITARKHAEEALQRQHDYLLILQEMALRLSGKEELAGFFEDILQRVCHLLETPHAFLALTRTVSSKLTHRFTSGLFADLTGSSLFYNEKLIARVSELCEPVIINDYQYLVDCDLGLLHNWVAVPLFQEKEVIGVIGIAYAEQWRHIGETEVALLKQFAQLASIGLVHEALHDANRLLSGLATVDPLTNLPNHRAVVNRVEETLAHCRSAQEECAILFLDIDRFKSINDTWGHLAGDEVLREVGRRLKVNVREEDFIGRYGGEEFAIVLVDVDQDVAMQTAERLREALCIQPCFWVPEPGEPPLAIPVTASIGVSMYRRHGMTREELIEAADHGMYLAKRRGRNQVRVVGDEKNLLPLELVQHMNEEMGNVGGSVLNALIAVANVHNRGAGERTHRMVSLAKATAEKLDCAPEVISLISQATLLHDIGKIGVPDTILHKEGALTEDEWAIVRRHPYIGSQILSEAGGIYSLLARIIVAHHERWDGLGYPQSIQEESIPLGARILAVVDSYDAMISDRPYRKALSKEFARKELLRCAGSQFDPGVVAAFLQVLDEQESILASTMMA